MRQRKPPDDSKLIAPVYKPRLTKLMEYFKQHLFEIVAIEPNGDKFRVLLRLPERELNHMILPVDIELHTGNVLIKHYYPAIFNALCAYMAKHQFDIHQIFREN